MDSGRKRCRGRLFHLINFQLIIFRGILVSMSRSIFEILLGFFGIINILLIESNWLNQMRIVLSGTPLPNCTSTTADVAQKRRRPRRCQDTDATDGLWSTAYFRGTSAPYYQPHRHCHHKKFAPIRYLIKIHAIHYDFNVWLFLIEYSGHERGLLRPKAVKLPPPATAVARMFHFLRNPSRRDLLNWW